MRGNEYIGWAQRNMTDPTLLCHDAPLNAAAAAAPPAPPAPPAAAALHTPTPVNLDGMSAEQRFEAVKRALLAEASATGSNVGNRMCATMNAPPPPAPPPPTHPNATFHTNNPPAEVGGCTS
jgi:hypothetical protein